MIGRIRIARIADSKRVGPLLRGSFFTYKHDLLLSGGRIVGFATLWVDSQHYKVNPKDLVILAPEAEAAAWRLYDTAVHDWPADAAPLLQAARHFDNAVCALHGHLLQWRPRLSIVKVFTAASEVKLVTWLDDTLRTPQNLASLHDRWQLAVQEAEALRQAEDDYFGLRH